MYSVKLTNLVNPTNDDVMGRGKRLVLVPASFIACALDIIIGVGAGIRSILNGGRKAEFYLFAVKQLESGILVRPYFHMLRAINPKALFLRQILSSTK